MGLLTGGAKAGKKAAKNLLDMAADARMKRAAEQGYTGPYYHGSGNMADISNRGFDPKLTGGGNDQYGSGFYFTDDPATASGYAESRLNPSTPKLGGEDSPGVIKTMLRMDNPKVIYAEDAAHINDNVFDLDESQVRRMLDRSEAVKRPLDADDINPLGDHYDSFWETGPEDWMLDDIAPNYAGPNVQYIEGDFFDGDSQGFRDALADVTGHDGLLVKYDNQTHAIPWNANQIRSTSAAFDPAKRNSANLLAGAAGTAGVGLLGMGSNEAEAGIASKAAKRFIKNGKGERIEAPRSFFRGTREGGDKSASGKSGWDSHLFASSNKADAEMYGRNMTEINAKPDAKILYEGTKEWQDVAGRWKKSESLMDYADRAANAAKDAGYDAAWFKRQSDAGTTIFNKKAFDFSGHGGIGSKGPLAAAGTAGVGLLGAGASNKGYAAPPTANDIFSQYGNEQQIQPAKHPKLAQAAGLLQGVETPLDGLLGQGWATEGVTGLLDKLSYGDKRKYSDYVKAAMDFF